MDFPLSTIHLGGTRVPPISGNPHITYCYKSSNYFDFVLSPSDRPPYIFKPWEGTTRSEECHWIQPSRLLQQRHLRPAQLPQSTSELCRWLCGRFDFCRLQPQTQDSHGMVLLLWLFSQQVLLWWCVGVLISSESSFVDSCWFLTYPQSLSESRETWISANANLKDLGGRRVVGQQIALFRGSSRFSKCGSMRRRWVRLAAIGLLASLMQLLFGLLLGGLKMFELVEQPG